MRIALNAFTSLSAFVFLIPQVSWAVGYRMPHQDPEAIARGNAFVATADNPSAVYYNPAGITQLEGQNFSFGVYAITPGIDYESPTGEKASPDSDFQFVPQIYYTYSPEDCPWSYGFGIYAPYGLGSDWGDGEPFPAEAQDATLVYLTASPVIAYQVSEQLSLAAGLLFSYSDVEFQQQGFYYEGDDYNAAFTLGILYQPCEQWSFGLNYRSESEMDYEGTMDVVTLMGPASFSTDASLVFPRSIDLGVSYRPTENWNFEFNLDWTDWDAVNVSTFSGDAPFEIPLPFNYESGFMYEFGVTRQLGGGYFLSAGYVYSENSVPDETLTPFNPDANLHIGSLGVGRRGEEWSWALAWHFAYDGGRTVTGNTPPLAGGPSADGEYETFNNAVNFSLTRSF